MRQAEGQNRLLSDVAAPKYRNSALPASNVGAAIPAETRIPDALAPFHLATPPERARRARDVLLLAWRIYRKGELSMVDSINAAAAPCDAAGEYAKISLRRILLELNLNAWESHPTRTRRDVHALFRRTIGKLTPHRGGWLVRR